MAKIRTDTEKLGSTESSVREQVKAIKDALKKMGEDVAALNAMWTGPANQAFNETFQNDIQELSGICDEIEGVADFEKDAREEYAKCERDVGTAIEFLRTGLEEG